MEISNGVAMLEIPVEMMGQKSSMNPTLIWNDETAILIDTGMPGHLELIRAAMNEVGVSMDQLKAVILTHQDIDHIGSLSDLIKETDGKIEVYAHEKDKPYIEGDLPLIKADKSKMSKEMLESMPKELLALYDNLPKGKVDHTLSDGQELPYCGGIRVIFTPGHTPGHISLYLKESKTLIAGDSMIKWEGKLLGPVERNTPDMATALQSLKKYVDFDVESVICYHGGLVNENANDQLRAISELNG